MAENTTVGPTPGAWTCFHCGVTFTDRLGAQQHFGRTEDSTPACIIKGADHGLLRALRAAEEQADDAIQSMHAESTDAARAYHSQRCRHTQALISAEESGYERGLHDSGRDELLAALKEVRDWINNWIPDFVQDDEWPETAERIDAALLKASPRAGEV